MSVWEKPGLLLFCPWHAGMREARVTFVLNTPVYWQVSVWFVLSWTWRHATVLNMKTYYCLKHEEMLLSWIWRHTTVLNMKTYYCLEHEDILLSWTWRHTQSSRYYFCPGHADVLIEVGCYFRARAFRHAYESYYYFCPGHANTVTEGVIIFFVDIEV